MVGGDGIAAFSNGARKAGVENNERDSMFETMLGASLPGSDIGLCICKELPLSPLIWDDEADCP